MKGLLKNMFPLDEEKSLWFVLAKKSISTTRNEAFVEKIHFHYMEKLFLLAKIENGFH